MRFTNKNAVVLAGSKGIGAAFALALYKEGANVVCVSRNLDNLENLKKIVPKNENLFLNYQGDVSDKKFAKNLRSFTDNNLGLVDILFLNSGGPPPGDYKSVSEKDWEKAIEGLLMGQIRIFQEFAPIMQKNNYGRIINLGSSVMQEPSEDMILSSTVRAAMATFCKAASISLAKNCVTVNTISTGGVKTERLLNLFRKPAEEEGISLDEKLSETEALIPINRFAEPIEFIQLILFLASEPASYVTGQTIGIDGGLLKATF